MTDILYSPGYGAGWSTWADEEQSRFALTFQPLIDAINKGEEVWSDTDEKSHMKDDFVPSHPAMQEFTAALKEKWPEDGESFFLGGARDLAVTQVMGPFQVLEYDGSESIDEGAGFIEL